MQLDCWSIQSRSFHFGRHGLGQELTMATMPSDSLFAALIARMARTHGAEAVEKFCKPFVDGKPPFVLSSTFPFVGMVKFFPVPLLRTHDVDQIGIQAKKLKDIKYVSEGAFRSMLAGASLASLHDSKLTLQGGQLLLSPYDFERLPADLHNENARIWAIEQRPRVTLDRSTSASSLFHIGQVRFAAGCGLWFAVRWLEKNASLQKTFSGLLHELADAGFGAERAVGMGLAEVRPLDALDLPDVKSAWVTLSRYLPTKEEVLYVAQEGSAYSIKQVGGWLDSPVNMGQRRRSVNLIEEGSVVGVKPEQIAPGRMEDVQPRYRTNEGILEPLGHPVYRCGFALAVGLEGGAG